jgi:hypothetical protein
MCSPIRFTRPGTHVTLEGAEEKRVSKSRRRRRTRGWSGWAERGEESIMWDSWCTCDKFEQVTKRLDSNQKFWAIGIKWNTLKMFGKYWPWGLIKEIDNNFKIISEYQTSCQIQVSSFKCIVWLNWKSQQVLGSLHVSELRFGESPFLCDVGVFTIPN